MGNPLLKVGRYFYNEGRFEVAEDRIMNSEVGMRKLEIDRTED